MVVRVRVDTTSKINVNIQNKCEINSRFNTESRYGRNNTETNNKNNL